MAPCRTLIVEDYEEFRLFLRQKLQQRANCQVIGETSDGIEAVRRAEELQPDLILIDVGLPTISGIEVARRVRKVSANSKTLFVSQDSCPDTVQAALDAGALGYVLKSDVAELLVAVDAVLQGTRFISRSLKKALV